MLRVTVDRGNAPARTGIGVYTESLVHALRELAADEVAVVVAATSWEGSRHRPLRRLVYLWNVRREARRGFDGADLVHFTNVYVPPRRSRVGYVGTIHDLDPMMLREAHTARYAAYFDAVARKTAGRAEVITVPTAAVGLEVQEVLKVPAERIAVCGNGLDRAFMEAADRTPAADPPLPILLAVGQLNRKKNIAWLVAAIARGVRTGALPRLQLRLAGGPGFGYGAIRAALRDAGDIAVWVGSPPLADLVALYRGCSAVVLPSLREGFGRALLEAMYCGKPMVASRIPSSVEVAGEAALYFEPGDEEGFYAAVREVLSGAGEERRRAAARRRLEAYAWKSLVPRYVGAYTAARPRP